jgi:PIN domain nuclease of toxin-antitoxin system
VNLLLDTHLLIWTAANSPRLSAKARALIEDPAHTLFFSSVSIWEIAIKRRKDRPDFPIDARRLRNLLLQNGFVEIDLTSDHGIIAADLPLHHHDPFDRALIAQARHEGLGLLTSDTTVAGYSDTILKV